MYLEKKMQTICKILKNFKEKILISYMMHALTDFDCLDKNHSSTPLHLYLRVFVVHFK